jgi:hypothetical protein
MGCQRFNVKSDYKSYARDQQGTYLGATAIVDVTCRSSNFGSFGNENYTTGFSN